MGWPVRSSLPFSFLSFSFERGEIFLTRLERTETRNNRLIFLDDILGPEGFAAIEHNDGSSLPFPFPSSSSLTFRFLCSHPSPLPLSFSAPPSPSKAWPLAGLRFKAGADEAALLAKLREAGAKGGEGDGNGFECYDTRVKEGEGEGGMLERWKFEGNEVRFTVLSPSFLEWLGRADAFLWAANLSHLLRPASRLGVHKPPRARSRHGE
jgi:hypothetical protein